MGEARRRKLAGEMPKTPKPAKPPYKPRKPVLMLDFIDYYPMMFTHMAILSGKMLRPKIKEEGDSQ